MDEYGFGGTRIPEFESALRAQHFCTGRGPDEDRDDDTAVLWTCHCGTINGFTAMTRPSAITSQL